MRRTGRLPLALIACMAAACSVNATDVSAGAGAGAAAGAGSGGAPVAGAAGTSGGVAGVAGVAGAGGQGSSPAGAGGSAGAAGSSGGGGLASGGTTGGISGSSGSSGSSSNSYLLYEDFESATVGQAPQGWNKEGNASVAEGMAVSGSRALAISATANGARRIIHPGELLGTGHWGRIRYKVQLPVPEAFVHSTLVALWGEGPTRGAEEVRVVDTVKQSGGPNAKHQFLYNVQPSGSEFGTGSSYDWTFDGSWHCAEWHIDAPSQAYEFFFDGDRVDSISFSKGAGNYQGAEIPTVIEEIRIGWNNYQSAPPGFTAWIDDIAVDDTRIGCD